jgi:ABC-type lipoprotein release transport system permease subunit
VYDPATIVGVLLLLGTIALAASLVPTLRIARIDPAETLRTQ